MFVAKKVHKSLFIAIFVLTTTLIWFVLIGFASNDDAKLDNDLPTTSFNSQLSRGTSQSLIPTTSEYVLVGLKTDNSIISQFSQRTHNNGVANLPITNMEPLFTSPVNSAIASINNEGQNNSIYRLWLDDGADVTAVLQTLKNDPSVAFAEPDYLAHIIATPNDPLYSGQWGLAKVQAPAAWDVTTGSSDTVIAVIDSGIDVNHPDLIGQLWTNPGETDGNGIDDDNNGYVDDVHGWNMVDDNADLSDNTGHGTEVAGIIAATSNNNTGVAGLCWQCRIMVVKVTQPGGVANYSDIAAGIYYAAQKGADVINLSLGGYSDSTTLRTVLADAAETAVIVGGAGNDNANTPFYPAAYNDYVLAVSGTSSSDTKVGTSNYGTWVDVTAPGEVITTTFDGSSYGASSGTSLAAPFAAGVAGLLRSQYPNWSTNKVRSQIIHTTDGIDGLNPGYENQLGSGRLNAQQSLTVAAQPLLIYASQMVDGEENGRPEPNSTIDVDITLLNDWADTTNVQATLSSSDPYVTIVTGTAVYGDIATYDNATNQSPFRITVSGSAPYAHDLALTLNVTADGGYTTAVPITITTASGIELISGLITTNTTWSNDKQYIVTGNILVQTGITLTIQAGTTIKVDGKYLIRVEGNMLAQGTKAEPISFSSNKTPSSVDDWLGIEANDGGILNLAYCEITSATTAVNLSGNNSTANIEQCNIHDNISGVIGNGNNANLTIIDSRIVHNIQHGIMFPGPNAIIDHNEIAYNRWDGIHASSAIGIGSITRNLVHHNNGDIAENRYGIFGGGGTVISNTILLNQYGIGFEDPSNTTFRHNNLWGNTLYDVNHAASGNQNLIISSNWWGTTDTNLIDQHIYDFQDNFNLGTVTYSPILTTPASDAPAFLHNLTVSPADPIGIETATFDLTFSRPMDESQNPVVTFGSTSPYTTYQVIDNAQWLDESHWRATFDVTSLIPRESFVVQVSHAQGTDGMEIVADSRFGFTVDYAGEITDQTPPKLPLVIAGGVAGDASTVLAFWNAKDPDSTITGYRYAIGSAPGATDIVNWTAVSDASITHNGLGLVEGRQYWLSVQARNNGGLWSASGYSAFISGQPYPQIFLPIIIKN